MGPFLLSGQSRTIAPQVVASGYKSDDFNTCSWNRACLMGKRVFPVAPFSQGDEELVNRSIELEEVACFG